MRYVTLNVPRCFIPCFAASRSHTSSLQFHSLSGISGSHFLPVFTHVYTIRLHKIKMHRITNDIPYGAVKMPTIFRWIAAESG